MSLRRMLPFSLVWEPSRIGNKPGNHTTWPYHRLSEPDGIQLIISCEWSENDDKLTADYLEQSVEMFEKAGFIDIQAQDTEAPPGADIHEMGGIRMGRDPKTSLLNKWNQVHQVKNVFVTDGACMTSTGTQNPTLTYMAITARAANYAVEELKKGNL